MAESGWRTTRSNDLPQIVNDCIGRGHTVRADVDLVGEDVIVAQDLKHAAHVKDDGMDGVDRLFK